MEYDFPRRRDPTQMPKKEGGRMTNKCKCGLDLDKCPQCSDEEKQEQMKKYYNESEYYELRGDHHPLIKSRYNMYTLDNVFKLHTPRPNDTIADLGCGWGLLSFSLLQSGYNVTSIDYSRTAILNCIKTAVDNDIPSGGFRCADATSTGFPDDYFDVVYCVDLVEHLYPEVYLKLLGEAHRILKPNGILVIYAPNPGHFFEIMRRHNIILKADPSHVDYKTMQRIKDSLDLDFEVIRSYYIESHIEFLGAIELFFLKIIPVFRRRIAVKAIKKGGVPINTEQQSTKGADK